MINAKVPSEFVQSDYIKGLNMPAAMPGIESEEPQL